jgi:tetratricopeptide (TPR) repeat protein
MAGFPDDIEGMIEYASKVKDEGNLYFKAGKNKKALLTYAKVFAFTKGIPGRNSPDTPDGGFDTSPYLGNAIKISEEEDHKCNELELATLTNMATICIKENQAIKAIEYAERALLRHNDSFKAHLRLAQGRALIHEWESARFSYLKAKQLAPKEHTAMIINELNRVKAHQKADDAKESDKQRKRLAGAFGSDSGGDEKEK